MRVPYHPAPGNDETMVDEASEEAVYTGIRCDLLNPGRGDPLKDGALVIKDAKIDWVGEYRLRPSKYDAVSFIHVPVLLPGLWDLHVHYGGSGKAFGNLGDPLTLLPGAGALAGAVIVEDLRRTLEAGFTSVRELGGYGGYLWPGVRDGYLVGPNIYSSLAALSITGGHGDIHNVPLCAIHKFAESEDALHYLRDGVDECTKAVRTMVRRGARVIKVYSSGGVLSLNDDPEDRQFSDAELKAIVDEAARTGRTVAAHAIGKAGIVAALNAGIKSIEHGCYIDQEVTEMMKEKGAVLVATRHIQESLYLDHDDQPEPVARKIEKIMPLTRKNYNLAIKAGVRIALGTDSFHSREEHRISHGRNAVELTYAVASGMSPLQAVEACTATPPELLGRQAPRSGQLREVYDAVVIAVAGNPLDDLAFLTRSANVTHVWKGGKLYKSP